MDKIKKIKSKKLIATNTRAVICEKTNNVQERHYLIGSKYSDSYLKDKINYRKEKCAKTHTKK